MERVQEQLRVYSGLLQAHNGYLEVFLNLGMIGLVLLILTLTQIFNKLRHSLDTAEAMVNLFFVYLMMMVIHNFTEASIMVPTYLISFLLFLIAITVVKAKEPQPVEMPEEHPILVRDALSEENPPFKIP